jgi:hypothetical protein
MTAPLENARAAWAKADKSLPDWIEALAIECGATSQNRVAERMGRSAALISQVLRAKYPADLSAVEERFRGVFLEARIECPALGTLPAHECQDWRRKSRAFASGNPLRVQMFRACAACPRNAREEQR